MREAESLDVAVATPTTMAPKLGEWTAVAGRLVYPALLLVSISIWFLAIRAPLWLDETLSYWQVSGGLAKVWSRSALMPSSIGYLYILWFAKLILGSSEIALKLPSMLALFAAVYFLFRAACEFYGQEIAFIACIFFCLESNVVFAATDARPYGFAMLATTLATFAFIRWMRRQAMREAIWFGAAACLILYFHYLFVSILPAFAMYYVIARWRSIRSDLRRLAAVLASFTVLSLPLLYRVASLYRSRQSHIVQEMRHPGLEVLNTIAPQAILLGFLIVAFLAALLRKIKFPGRTDFPGVLLGPLLALVPAGILIAISLVGAEHLLIPRYLSVAAPGSALMWALLTSRIDSKWWRQIFCVVLVAVVAVGLYRAPITRRHELSFKAAHAFVNTIVASDQPQVLVCSAFIESDYEPMPTNSHSENALLSQLAYYPIHAPVGLLPMTLNDETLRVAGKAVLAAAQRRKRFLAIAAPDSYETLDWLARYTRGRFMPQLIGNFDDILVAEFRPMD